MSVIEDDEEYFTVWDTEHIQRWIDEIKPYLGTELDAIVLKYALSYTLQSLRNNENMNRFKWSDAECFTKSKMVKYIATVKNCQMKK